MPSLESRKLAAIAERIRASGAAGRRNHPVTGFVWVTVAMAAFAALGAISKYAMAEGLHPLQVLFLRNLMCLVMLLPLLAVRGRAMLVTEQSGLYVGRIGLAFLSMMAWFSAIALIPLAEVTAIGFLSPLFATLFAVLFLGEIVRARRWTALLVGLAGAMIMLRPGGSELGAGEAFALFSALSAGIIGPLLKQLTGKDDADKIVFLSTLGLVPLSLIPALFVWQWPDPWLWPALLALGVVATIGHIALLRGFASTDASLVFTFEFSRLPFAVAIGWLFFAESPDVWTLVGAMVIFASAAYITRREAHLKADPLLTSGRDFSDPLCVTPVRLRFSD